jgi:ATP-dependent DNA helicase DinG
MTSATLSVGRGLEYFQNRIGATDAETLQVDSPFDYPRQMKVYIPKKMPDPTEGKAYEEALARWIEHFITMTNGKAFVLFTSYRTMQNLATAMESFFSRKDLTLLVQGAKLPRHRLLQKFKEDTNSVLFGTDSFWQGVDVPGEALSNVIITRLPFAVPDHPLIQAKLEQIEARGGDAFREYSLPEAILKFRQGVGRLIRTKQDQGIIALLDNRVLTKNYGKAFLDMLPECPREILS